MDNSIAQKLNKFFSSATSSVFKKGETLIYSQDNPDCVFYLMEGYVNLNTIFDDGKKLILNIFKPGSFFPMMCMLGGIENPYNYECLTNASLKKARKEEFDKFIKNNPDVLLDLTKRVLIGLNGLAIHMTRLLEGNSYDKVISALYVCSKRFGKEINNKIIISLPLTQQTVSEMAGIRRETANIILKRLERKKFILYKNRALTIINSQIFHPLFKTESQQSSIQTI